LHRLRKCHSKELCNVMSFLALFDGTNVLSLGVLLENYVVTRLAQLTKDEIYCRVLSDGDNDNIPTRVSAYVQKRNPFFQMWKCCLGVKEKRRPGADIFLSAHLSERPVI